MTPEIDLLSVIYLIGAAQGVFLVVALLDKKIVNNQANRYLGVFLFIFTLSLVDEFLYQSHYFYEYPHLIGIIWPLEYLYGPLFYFYVRELTSFNYLASGRKNTSHLILVFVGFLLAIPTWILEPGQKISMLYGLNPTETGDIFRANIFDGLATLFVVVQIAVYIRLSFRHLQHYRQSIRQQFSEIERINLSWLVTLLWLLIPLWILYIVDIFFSDGLGIGNQAGILLHVILVLIIYGMGYMGLRQPSIFKLEQASYILAEPETEGIFKENDKYSKSKLSDEHSEILKARLLSVMAEHKPYLENGVTLSQLTNIMECTPNNLSQVINDGLGKSFFDFINGYRIVHAKQQLLAPERVTVLQVAINAGFNSKSAFYTAFKKEVGMTPSQYRKTS